MVKPVKRIAVTGGAGQIAYSILFRIASGELLGHDQPIALHILEVEEALGFLKGVVMELEDCAYPLLKEIKIGSDPFKLFEGIDYAFLIGAKPRTPGMERKDLLADNGKIFINQGKALNASAAKGVRVLVVGNPCNTNCLIAMRNAPDLDPAHFSAMMRLDENRASAYLAKKAHVAVTAVDHVVIWGNHSSTQVPDFINARINGQPATDLIKDRPWLETELFETVQKRGAAVLAARGKSSAASAAHAAIGAMQSMIVPTPPGKVFSCARLSDGNPYGIHKGLIFSFPCRHTKEGKVEIVSGFHLDEFLKHKIKLTEKELLEEKELVQNYV